MWPPLCLWLCRVIPNIILLSVFRTSTVKLSSCNYHKIISMKTGPGNGMMPSDNKLLPQPMLTKFHEAICCHRDQWVNLRDKHVPLTRKHIRFTNGFLPVIQIRWKLRLALIPLLAIRSQHVFAHATTAQLSCHAQNFVAITVLKSRWEWNEISIEFELRWKTVSGGISEKNTYPNDIIFSLLKLNDSETLHKYAI